VNATPSVGKQEAYPMAKPPVNLGWGSLNASLSDVYEECRDIWFKLAVNYAVI
jgi:hypothetical protein